MTEWQIWWAALCVAAAFNTVAWFYSASLLRRREGELPGEVYSARRQVLLLSAVYVLGCGFRSVLPMIDAPRICLHDTWLSRIAVGRSVATVAELAFVAQWALLMREAAALSPGVLAAAIARALVPIIVIAELVSWGAVLTTNNLLHAIENSLWALAAALAIAAFAAVRPHADRNSRPFIDAAIVGAAAYIAFMVTVDVPMYLSRWQAELAQGIRHLSPGEGLRELLQRCTVIRDWLAWRQDALWLSLYFTYAVWISIALAHAPPLSRSAPAASPTRAGGSRVIAP